MILGTQGGIVLYNRMVTQLCDEGGNMPKVEVNRLPRIEYEAGMLVEQRQEAVLCAITARIAAIIGAIF